MPELKHVIALTKPELTREGGRVRGRGRDREEAEDGAGEHLSIYLII
jgi:hypothetical protein